MVDMRYLTLIKVRDSLDLTALEAAQYIGKTDVQTWLKWESNTEPAPHTVKTKIDAIMARYKSVCEVAAKAHHDGFSLKRTYEAITEVMHEKSEHELLEHKLVKCAVESVFFTTASPNLI